MIVDPTLLRHRHRKEPMMTAMREAVAHLKERAAGIASLRQFQRDCESALRQAHDEAAFLRLLADLTGRFVDRYDDQPLEVAAAKAAYDRLVRFAERALAAERAEDKLKLLNELGSADLG
jgi:hypothetical protein